MRGFCAIGVYHPKTEANIGSLWRSASLMGASFIYTVGKRYSRQPSGTMKTPRHLPLFHFQDIGDLMEHLPYDCPLVAVEQYEGARELPWYTHPERACYLLGSEDSGIPMEVLYICKQMVQIPTDYCLNVAVAGSIVLYDRLAKTITGMK